MTKMIYFTLEIVYEDGTELAGVTIPPEESSPTQDVANYLGKNLDAYILLRTQQDHGPAITVASLTNVRTIRVIRAEER